MAELNELENSLKKIQEELKAKKREERELKKGSKRNNKLITLIKERIKKYPELITVPILLVIWLITPIILRMYDPQAGGFNTGYLQIPVNSLLLVLIYLSASWIIFRMLYGTLYKYLTSKDYKTDFNNLAGWQKIVLSYSLYFLLFLAFVLLSFILS